MYSDCDDKFRHDMNGLHDILWDIRYHNWKRGCLEDEQGCEITEERNWLNKSALGNEKVVRRYVRLLKNKIKNLENA